MTHVNVAYSPSAAPLDGGALAQWCAQEFSRIAYVLQEGALQGLLLDVNDVLPERPHDGMLRFFRSGVVSVGSAAGCYQYRAGAWVAL